MSRDLGDFQTPLSLVKNVVKYLASLNKEWTRALEPTCGQGNFIAGLLDSHLCLKEIQGIEFQEEYAKRASAMASSQEAVSIAIRQANIFDLDLRTDLQWKDTGKLLVVGNPPWVTNSALSMLQSSNVPNKTNFKKFTGLEAMTGSSNFDIAEYIILKLIQELSCAQPTIAMLCKTLVARNVLQFAADSNLPISDACIRKIDSRAHFGAMVDACLFCIDVGLESRCYQAKVYSSLDATEPDSIIGIIKGKLVSNIGISEHIASLDGVCPLVWRQGVKHDAASVVELTYDASGQLFNKQGETVDVEKEYIYPLLKSSDLGGKTKERSKRAIIVTQRRIGENTLQISSSAPKLWKYLVQHQEIFDKRKSSIYKGHPPFSMFGVGDYSFAPYKVAISGMYKTLKFSVVGPVDGRPVMFDDTCYFIPCASARQAAFIFSLLSDQLCQDFLQFIIFWDAKRPITKKLLQRVDLVTLLDRVDKQALLTRATSVLERLGYAMDDVWPDDLSAFLKAYSDGENKKASQQANLYASQVAQMSLLDAQVSISGD
jgi:hypothetical protein